MKKEKKLLQASIDNIGSYRSAICPTTVIMYSMVPMYTVHASVRSALVLLLLPTVLLCLRADLCILYIRQGGYVRCKLYLVWVGIHTMMMMRMMTITT